ncbi:hypothetical protein CTAYLR_003606 [Chrysophaeum taylorii]|uniref:Receptor ligand binding region domain-containing protein n=1 Tax=Chrysophaeum taylorii TaxID=2483200 RepID=A0AAD7UC29_9STRA|nr:hypothetical protein CTAYLR_003606 [Chrysophaeum taylorii]
MLRTNPKIHGVFAFCSDDVADVSSVDARANLTNDLRSYGVAFDATNFVVLSASSTATEISSESYYPHVARLSSPESEVGKAVSSLVDHYGWRRVAVVHDDSLWARSSAQSFIDAISSRVDFVTFLGSGICLGGNCNGAGETLGITVSRSGFNVTEILDVLEALDARIIYLATYVQQEIFAEMYRQRRIWGSDYALITNLPQTASLVDDYHNVDIDAVKGQEGSLGFIQYAPSYGEETVVSDYLDSWRQVMSVDACNSRVESTNATILDGDDASSAPYCDVDGDFTTSHDYSMFCVDAIVIFAKAIAAQELNTNSRLLASETYAMILNQTFEGSSGTVQLHPDSGDRLGKFSLLNLQINEAMESSSAARRALWNSYEPQRQLVVILESLQQC